MSTPVSELTPEQCRIFTYVVRTNPDTDARGLCEIAAAVDLPVREVWNQMFGLVMGGYIRGVMA